MSLAVVELKFWYGQAQLTVRSPTNEVTIKNHWINDRFSELVNCVDLLLGGFESVSCRWQGVAAEGHFVDLVRDPAGGISIAVHAFRYPEGDTYSQIWSAERGDLVLSTHVPFTDFIRDFATTLRLARATAVDTSGMLTEYPRPFPQATFEHIEARAARMGYKPTPLWEIVNPPVDE